MNDPYEDEEAGAPVYYDDDAGDVDEDDLDTLASEFNDVDSEEEGYTGEEED